MHQTKQIVYDQLDPVLHRLYQLRCIERKMTLSLIERRESNKLQKQKDEIIKKFGLQVKDKIPAEGGANAIRLFETN